TIETVIPAIPIAVPPLRSVRPLEFGLASPSVSREAAIVEGRASIWGAVSGTVVSYVSAGKSAGRPIDTYVSVQQSDSNFVFTNLYPQLAATMFAGLPFINATFYHSTFRVSDDRPPGTSFRGSLDLNRDPLRDVLRPLGINGVVHFD